jgi:hypothetical protein
MNNWLRGRQTRKARVEPPDDRTNQQFYSPASKPTAGYFGWRFPFGPN